jgi:hypothetical protein
MRLGVALRTASMEASREGFDGEALKGHERHVLLHVICHMKVHVQSIYTLGAEKRINGVYL